MVHGHLKPINILAQMSPGELGQSGPIKLCSRILVVGSRLSFFAAGNMWPGDLPKTSRGMPVGNARPTKEILLRTERQQLHSSHIVSITGSSLF